MSATNRSKGSLRQLARFRPSTVSATGDQESRRQFHHVSLTCPQWKAGSSGNCTDAVKPLVSLAEERDRRAKRQGGRPNRSHGVVEKGKVSNLREVHPQFRQPAGREKAFTIDINRPVREITHGILAFLAKEEKEGGAVDWQGKTTWAGQPSPLIKSIPESPCPVKARAQRESQVGDDDIDFTSLFPAVAEPLLLRRQPPFFRRMTRQEGNFYGTDIQVSDTHCS
jgi:hypothetical protein